MQDNMRKSSKKRAPRSTYISQNQLKLDGFTSPFYEQLNPNNRWVHLAKVIPWDSLVGLYQRRNPPKATGRPPLNPRVIIGAMIIKHICALDDEEVVVQITENMYMQYFLGYSSYSSEPPFDSSLFVEFRKRMGEELIAEMNNCILEFAQVKPKVERDKSSDEQEHNGNKEDPPNQGELLMDATVSPQDIAYPTDINLLNDARKMTEKIIDYLYQPQEGNKKPRTYRQKARKKYLQVAKNRNPSRKTIRRGIREQLQYLKRNLKSIDKLLDQYESFPLEHKWQRYYWIVQLLYAQQRYMYENKTHQVEDRIVSIHQPHVRPMVRGKARTKTEFGAKIHVSLVNGYSFLDTISWDAFNESKHLKEYVEKYRARYGCYPAKVHVDQIYATRENRKWLKEIGVKLAAKPLGRPSVKAVVNHVSPGERNPIEGKFGQAKNGYGMNLIRARLKATSQSWIATIIMVLNLVKLTGQALLCLSFSVWRWLLSEMYELMEANAFSKMKTNHLVVRHRVVNTGFLL